MTEGHHNKAGHDRGVSAQEGGRPRNNDRRRGRGNNKRRGSGPKPLAITERGVIDHLHVGLDEASYIIFDLESTGGNPDKNGITEVFALRFHQGRIKDTFYSLVNPQIPIPPIVRKMTGINNRMVKDAPLIDEVMPRFVEFIKDDILVSHNTIGDMKFLRHFSQKVVGTMISNYYLCTHLLVEKLLPKTPDKSLKGLSIHLNLHSDGDHHRAETDTYLTLELFKVLQKEMRQKNFESVVQAIRFQGDFESACRLGWAVDGKALEAVVHKPGVFQLVDHQEKVLFLSSAQNLSKEVRKLERFQALPKQLMKAVLASTNVITKPADTFFEATLAEAEGLSQHPVRFEPNQWHQRTSSFFYMLPEGDRWLCTIGPLEAGAVGVRGPIRGGREGQVMLENIGAIFGAQQAKRGVWLDQEKGRILQRFLDDGRGADRLQFWQWPKLFFKTFRLEYREQQEMVRRLSAAALPPELKPLAATMGMFAYPNGSKWDIYTVVGGIPTFVEKIDSCTEETVKTPAVVTRWLGLLDRESKITANYPLQTLQANLINCLFWWLSFGVRRHGGRFWSVTDLKSSAEMA